MDKMIHDVFISYSRKDYEDDQKNVIPDNDVSKIKDALSEAGITYWFDEEGIYSGQNFVDKIVTNIENARIFLFLSTANSNNSPWTCKEIASADELKKHIIPVRMDSSPYNKKVLFRIADLDYIEYYTNPQKGIEDLIKSIKSCLKEMAAEEMRRLEEEKKRKELERQKEEERKQKREQEAKRLQEKQDRLVSEIKLACSTLNNEEAKLELERENIVLKANLLTDSSLRDALVNQIKEGGVIHKKYKDECSALTKEIVELKTQYEHEIEKLKMQHEHEIHKILKRCKELESESNRETPLCCAQAMTLPINDNATTEQTLLSELNAFYKMFWKNIRTCLFVKYANFKGKSDRSEFWSFLLFFVWICVASLICFGLFLNFGEVVLMPFLGIVLIINLILLCPLISVSIRRLHDIGLSGWWWLLNIIPYAGNVAFLVLCCQKSQEGDIIAKFKRRIYALFSNTKLDHDDSESIW